MLVPNCDQGNNDKFLGTKKFGHLYANCENTCYFFYLVNRPVFVLKCGQGFELIWHEDGSISFWGNNNKFVGMKKSGHLYTNCDSDIEENMRYFFYLVNQPVLVLKSLLHSCEY